MIAIRSATVLTIFRGRRYVFFSCILPSPYLFFCFPPARFGHRPRSQEAPPLKLACKRTVQAGHQKPTLHCGPVAAGFHQSHAQTAFRQSRRRSPQKVGVFTNRRSSHKGGRLHQSVRAERVPLKPASFTTEGGRLHQSSSTCYGRLHKFVVHMLWASSPVHQHLSDARTRAVRILSTLRVVSQL